MSSLHRHEAQALRVLIGALMTSELVVVAMTMGWQDRVAITLIDLAELTMLGAFAALVATAASWDRLARRLMVMCVTFGVSSVMAEALADLIVVSRVSHGGLAFVELVATRQEVSLVLSAISAVGFGLGIAAFARLLGRPRHHAFATAAGLIVIAIIVGDRLALEQVLPTQPTLWLRPVLLLLAAFAAFSRYLMIEINPPTGITDERVTGDDRPEAWRRAARGLRIIRAAEIARVLLVAVVILLGLVVMRTSESWGLFRVYGLGLAILCITATELIGLSHLAAIPTRSGARGPALAALAVGLIGLALTASAFGADLSRLGGQRFEPTGFDIDLGPRLTMLVTITAIFLALRAIAIDVGATASARSSAYGALFYGLAIISLMTADTLDRAAGLGTPSLVAKLLAFGFFVAALGRLLTNLKEAPKHLDNQRRHTLGSEFT